MICGKLFNYIAVLLKPAGCFLDEDVVRFSRERFQHFFYSLVPVAIAFYTRNLCHAFSKPYRASARAKFQYRIRTFYEGRDHFNSITREPGTVGVLFSENI